MILLFSKINLCTWIIPSLQLNAKAVECYILHKKCSYVVQLYIVGFWSSTSNSRRIFQMILQLNLKIIRIEFAVCLHFLLIVCNIWNHYDERVWGLYACNFMCGTGSRYHYNDVIMSAMASQITGVSIVCSTLGSGGDRRKHQSSASPAFVRGIHRWPVNSPGKRPVIRKMFPSMMTSSCVDKMRNNF